MKPPVIFVVAFGAGAAAFWWLPPTALREIAAEAIASLAIMAGLLAQLILFMATILQVGRMKAERIELIADRLDKQQRDIGILVASMMVQIIIFMVAKVALAPPQGGAAPTGEGWEYLSFLAVFLATLTGFRCWAFFFAIRAMQQLRHQQLIATARAEEAERMLSAAAAMEAVPPRAGTQLSVGITRLAG